MHCCDHEARPDNGGAPRKADPRPLLSRDLLLTVLLTSMRFNPQEAMIVRAGMRHAANSLSAAMARFTSARSIGGASPRNILRQGMSGPWTAALCSVALLLPIIRPMAGGA